MGDAMGCAAGGGIRLFEVIRMSVRV
jgi:hypothetical protein